jgi:signal peptidase I
MPGPVRSVVETVLTLAVAVGIAIFAQAFVVKPYRVPTGSMLPTLKPGDRVLADRLSIRFSKPHRGEIVVFHPPSCRPPFAGQDNVCTVSDPTRRDGASSTTFIKRVIGLPGDILFARRGHVFVQPPGKKAFRLSEPYTHGAPTADLGRIRIPSGQYFMMGDNRTNSDDSRMWGTEPGDDIIGVARARYWPLARIGIL